MPFKPGTSGNPSGYKRGHPHRLTQAVKKIVDKDGAKIVEAIVKSAVDGDVAARQMF